MKNLLKHFIKTDKTSKDLIITPILKPITSTPPKPAPTSYNVGRTMSKIIQPIPQSKIIHPSPQPIKVTTPSKVAYQKQYSSPSAPSQIRQYNGLATSKKLAQPRPIVTSETEKPRNTLLR